MDLNGKTVFLAGATGLAGSAIIRRLVDGYPNARVRAVYNKTTPFIEHEKVEYAKGDLRSKQACRELAAGCDYAVMGAANTGGAAVLESHPWSQINDNVIMNVQMLEAFALEKLRRVVYISTASLYHESDQQIREDDLDLNRDPCDAHYGMGWVVRFIEKICRFWHERCGVEILIARAANIFGPFDKFDPKTSNFIPALIRKAVEKHDPFEVWGSPDVTRDVIYSEDFAGAIVAMLSNDRIIFDVFNVGSGVKTKVADVVDWALKYAEHKPSSVQYRSDRPS
ncbi:MAG: NAD(P)-dependent oxidoreductase, partial [Phycisphaerales bacterium]